MTRAREISPSRVREGAGGRGPEAHPRSHR